jgi:hypothetical protein
MFNLYKFEQKLKQQKEFEEAASAEAQAKFEKKFSKIFSSTYFIEQREEMSKKYRDRVTKFIKQVNC